MCAIRIAKICASTTNQSDNIHETQQKNGFDSLQKFHLGNSCDEKTVLTSLNLENLKVVFKKYSKNIFEKRTEHFFFQNFYNFFCRIIF